MSAPFGPQPLAAGGARAASEAEPRDRPASGVSGDRNATTDTPASPGTPSWPSDQREGQPLARASLEPAGAAPAEPARVTGLDRLVSLFEVLLCSGLPTQLFITAVLFVVGLPPSLSLGFVATLSLLDTALLVFLVLILLRLRGEAPARVLLGRRRPRRELGIGLALAPFAFGAAAGLGWAIQRHAPWLHNMPDNPLAGLMTHPVDYVIVGAVAIVAGGLREEVQRAFVLHRFDQHLGGGTLGLVAFSVVFGAGHFVQGYDVMVITGLLGLLWGGLYLARRSVIAPLVCHAAFNLVEVVAFGVAR